MRFVPVDAATDCRRDGRVFFSAGELLVDRGQWQGLWVSAPEVEFGYLLVKQVLKGALTTQQKPRLQALLQELGDKAGVITQRLFGSRLGERVTQWIATENWTTLESHLSRLQWALLWRALWRDPLNLCRYWLPEGARLWRRWRYPTGLCIAVLGPDGAGKSALIEHLRADLASAFRRSEVFQLRLDILRQPRDDGPVTAPYTRPPHPLWLSLLKLPCYVLEYSLEYALRVRPRLVQSTLVLFDHYYDDILVDARRYRYGGPPGLVHWLQRAIPRPDLFLILDASAGPLRQRKQELPGAELRRQCLDYRQLAAALGNAYVLDASQPPAEAARQAHSVILDFLHERYLQRRHLWFGTEDWQRADWQAALSPLVSVDEGHCVPGRAPDPYGQRHPERSTVPFGLVALSAGRGYLVPLESRRTAVAGLTLYSPQTRKARIGRRLLVAGLRLGVAQPFLRRVWLPLAGEQHSHQAPLLAYLQDLLGQRHLTFAISLGTPGPHRKPVIQMMDAHGHILGYAKIGHDAASNALVQNEARVLQGLATMSWQALTLPQVIATGCWQGHDLCVLSAPQAPGERMPQRLTPLHVAALRELWIMQMEWMPLAASPFWMTLTQQVQQVEDAYYRSMIEQGMANAEKWLARHPIPFHFCHGDFTAWNLLKDGNKLFVVDWECALQPALPCGTCATSCSRRCSWSGGGMLPISLAPSWGMTLGNGLGRRRGATWA